MTRYAIDAHTAVRLVRDGITVSDEHQLVAPQVMRSQALSAIYRGARAGEIAQADVRVLLDRLTEMRIRLLGDRVLRATAWKIAVQLDGDDTVPAEYLAVATLQADALVTPDPAIAAAAMGIVELATYDELIAGSA